MPATKKQKASAGAKKGAAQMSAAPRENFGKSSGPLGDKEIAGGRTRDRVNPSIAEGAVGACACPHCGGALDPRTLFLGKTTAKLTPCAFCKTPLRQRERIRPCPFCSKNNWKFVEEEKKAGAKDE